MEKKKLLLQCLLLVFDSLLISMSMWLGACLNGLSINFYKYKEYVTFEEETNYYHNQLVRLLKTGSINFTHDFYVYEFILFFSSLSFSAAVQVSQYDDQVTQLFTMTMEQLKLVTTFFKFA